MIPSTNSCRGVRRGSAMRRLIHAGAFLLVASPLAGQSGTEPLDLAGRPAGRAAAVAKDPAALEATAQRLHDRPDRYRRAAKLYVEAAELRGDHDSHAIENRRMAGRLFFYIGDEASAQAVMEDAAAAALAIGDIVTAADALLDAAHIAMVRGRGESVTDLIARARLLARSPLLDGVSRSSILRRAGA